MNACSDCDRVLAPHRLALHRSRYHGPVSRPYWLCPLCGFSATQFVDALSHCLLVQHPASRLRNIRWSGLVEAESSDSESSADSESQEERTSNDSGPEETCTTKVASSEGTTHSPESEINSSEGTTQVPKIEEKVVMSPTLTDPTNQTSEEENNKSEPSKRQNATGRAPKREIVTKASPPTPAKESLACSKCELSFTYASEHSRNAQAVKHVLQCFQIKPFRCGSCGLLSTWRETLVRHILKSKLNACYNANILLINRKQNNKLISDSLAACYPTSSITWNGFK